MTPALARLIVGLAGSYLLAGAVFTIPFLARGVDRVDPAAPGAPLMFRVLIAPGVVMLWPLLLLRWAAGSVAPPDETNAHRSAAR